MNRKERRAKAKSGTGGATPAGTMAETMRRAVALHQAGKARDAAALYDRILAAHPDQPDALHFSGILLAQTGNPEAGAKRLERAVALAPDRAEFHANLGQVFSMQGRLDEAERALRTAIELDPRLPDAHNNLGNVLKARGRLEAARDAYAAAVDARPDFAGAWSNLGNVLSDLDDLPGAEAALRKAAEIAPETAAVHNNLGALLIRKGETDAAEASLRHALELDSRRTEAHEHLGTLCLDSGRFPEALEHFDAALAAKPGDVSLLLNAANALRQLGRLEAAQARAENAVSLAENRADAHRVLGVILRERHSLAEAETRLRHALSLAPEDPATLNALAWTLDGQGRLSEAADVYEQAIAARPGYVSAMTNLAVCLQNQGLIDAALETGRQVLDREPGHARATSNYLMTLNYTDRPPEAIWAAHREFAPQILSPGTASPRPASGPDRRLRIGLVSPDLRRHSVAFFLAPLLEALDRDGFHVTCFAEVTRPDATTERLRALADGWVDTVGLDDTALVARIRDAEIDILIDLAGHTRRNRLAVFAAKAAPVQATWLGYANTTGLDTIDYRLTDAVADPPGDADRYHSERLLRLPEGFLCYEPAPSAPPVAEKAANADPSVVFASFNNWSKAGDPTLDLWASVLNSVPDARLLLKARALGDERVRARCIDAFAARGVAGDRLDISGWHADPDAGLAAYGKCDIALDTTPYNGTTTTCEALWMGVPVITLAGDRHAGRVGASLLVQAGLGDLVAADEAAFVDIASRLAGDRARLAELRAGLRDRLENSGLCDGAGFARRFEGALREMWETACAG